MKSIYHEYIHNIYVNKLIPDATEQRIAIANLIDKKEDKKEYRKLKELMKDKYKVALNTADEDELFEEETIIYTSLIQNRQSIKKNILSIFVQTYIDRDRNKFGCNCIQQWLFC